MRDCISHGSSKSCEENDDDEKKYMELNDVLSAQFYQQFFSC
jgi:hypothetical protein